MIRVLSVASCVTGALCCLLGACSALGLDELELVPCTPGELCVELNEGLPADQCTKYYCSERGLGCEPLPTDDDRDQHLDMRVCAAEADAGPLDCADGDSKRYFGGEELCDGIDNDCDLLIDEGQVPRHDTKPNVAIDPDVVQVSSAISSAGELYLALTHQISQGSFQSSRIKLDANDNGESSPLPFALEDRCDLLPRLPETCNFAQLAVGLTPDLVIGAGVQRVGSCVGQLRVGVGSAADFELDLGTPPADSDAAFAIDLDLPSACTLSGPCPGASDPVLAVLPAEIETGESQAVAVWRTPDECAGRDAGAGRVAALGLFVEGEHTDSARLVGTNENASEQLGTIVGDGRPAITAFAGRGDSAGYFIAYPARDQIELRFIPRLFNHASVKVGMLSGSIDAPHSRNVVLAVGPATTDTPQGLAVAYVTDAAPSRTIVLTRLSFDGGDAPHLEAAGSSLTIESVGEIVAGPSLAYSPEGFAVDDSGESLGGFLIVWVARENDAGEAGERLMAARIAEAGLRPVGSPLELAHGTFDHAFTYLKHRPPARPALQYGYVTNDQIYVYPITCPE